MSNPIKESLQDKVMELVREDRWGELPEIINQAIEEEKLREHELSKNTNN